MNKLDNKGLTLVELIISVSLISMVMLFMYRMLSAITFEKDNDYISTVNQQQRIEIIDEIEKAYANDPDNTIVNVTNEDIILEENEMVTHIWKIKGGNISGKQEMYYQLDDNYKLYVNRIVITTENTKNQSSNNNNLDDITYSYIK